MQAASRRAAAWAATALQVIGVTAGAVPPQPQPSVAPFASPLPRPELASLTELDDALEALRRASWQLASNFGELRDARGRTPGQDVDQWLLTPANLAKLEGLRANAAARTAKGDQRGLRLTLSEASALIERESYMGGVLWAYWSMWDLTRQHGSLIAAITARITSPVAGKEATFDMIAARVGQDLPKAMAAESPAERSATIEWLGNERRDLLRDLNGARQRYARQLSEQERQQGHEAMVFPRDTPCPEAATPVAGADKAAFADGNATPDSFYPDSSRRAEFEGEVTVRAWVSATGCMQKATIYASSGVPDLDDAAIRWTQQARFRPAERDHHPVESQVKFVVKFQLRQ